MPRIDFKAIGEIIKHRFLQGTNVTIDPQTDTCTVNVNGSIVPAILFFHCTGSEAIRGNGAVTDAATEFVVGDQVFVVLGKNAQDEDIIRVISPLIKRKCIESEEPPPGTGVARGYFAGGDTSNYVDENDLPYVWASIEALTFSDETLSMLGITLAIARLGLRGVSSGGNYGAFAGGFNWSLPYKIIEALHFAEIPTIRTLSAVLAMPLSTMGTANSITAGYFAGGMRFTENTLEPSFENEFIDSLHFLSESVFTLTATLSLACAKNTGVNSYGKAYFDLGEFSEGLIDALTFSDNTKAALSARLTDGRYSSAGLSSYTKGYFVGGIFETNYSAIIESLNFSTETTASLGDRLSSGCAEPAGVNSKVTRNKGYIGGGERDSSVQTIESFDFSSETCSVLGVSLSVERDELAGISNG